MCLLRSHSSAARPRVTNGAHRPQSFEPPCGDRGRLPGMWLRDLRGDGTRRRGEPESARHGGVARSIAVWLGCGPVLPPGPASSRQARPPCRPSRAPTLAGAEVCPPPGTPPGRDRGTPLVGIALDHRPRHRPRPGTRPLQAVRPSSSADRGYRCAESGHKQKAPRAGLEPATT
jgi:hypothetical protein